MTYDADYTGDLTKFAVVSGKLIAKDPAGGFYVYLKNASIPGFDPLTTTKVEIIIAFACGTVADASHTSIMFDAYIGAGGTGAGSLYVIKHDNIGNYMEINLSTYGNTGGLLNVSPIDLVTRYAYMRFEKYEPLAAKPGIWCSCGLGSTPGASDLIADSGQVCAVYPQFFNPMIRVSGQGNGALYKGPGITFDIGCS